MSIVSLDSHALTQRCDNCNSIRTWSFADLLIGTPTEPPNPLVILLPGCECRSQEFLFRTSIENPSDSIAYRHALLVAKLYSELASAGRVHEALHADELAPPPPDAELRRFFPDGFQLTATNKVAERENNK